MDKDEITVLNEMYEECIREKEAEEKKLKDNINRISEIDVFINSMKEETDLKVFSPRSPENIYGDKIREKQKEKNDFEKENQNHYQKLNRINRQIEQISQLISKQKSESCRQLKILDIQEKERQRIARELHDSSVQNLTHLIHTIELSSMFIDQDPIRAKLELETCMNNLKTTIHEMRETIFNLRPMSFDDLGFVQCIDDFILNIKNNYKNIDIEYDVCELDQYSWSGKEKNAIDLFLVTVYRIIQEGIMNALKYSGSDKISLKVWQNDKRCCIIIKDNGKGFSVEKIAEKNEKHFGIPIMQERVSLLNGDMKLDSSPGNGTQIEISIPLI